MIKILHLKQGYYVRYGSVFYTLYNNEEKEIKTTANVQSFIEYIKGVVNLTKKDIKIIKEM